LPRSACFSCLLTNDPPALARAAERAIDRAAENGHVVVLTDIVLAELIYVLTTVYGLSRGEIRNLVRETLDVPAVETTDPDLLEDAVNIWRADKRLDFADAYLAALARATYDTAVLSFDRDFDRIEGSRRLDPRTFNNPELNHDAVRIPRPK
jgi:predicted nucleic acid-binding protein